MSVYRPKRRDGTFRSEFFHFDFVIKTPDGASRRFHGSTGQRTRSKAERVENQKRELAATGRLQHAMTLAEASFKYEEDLEGQPSLDDTRTSLGHLCRLIGGEALLVSLDGAMLADAVRKRSAERVTIQTRSGPRQHGIVSNATVNRQIVQTARRLLNRARTVWKIPVQTDIAWKALLKPERDRMCILTDVERMAYIGAFRDDLRPIVLVYLLTGCRRAALCGLLKSAVSWERDGFTILLKRKAGDEPREHFITFTPELRAIFAAEMGKSPVPQVFTYVRQVGKLKGMRVAIGYSSFRKEHQAARAKAGVPEFRFHDARHDTATRALRATKNLKLVQRMLGHADIASTARYAHVIDDDLREGMASFSLSRNSPEGPIPNGLAKAPKAQENEG